MRSLVIGYGSIGSRHTRILKELGYRVAVVSTREIDYELRYNNLEEAICFEKPKYIIVANQTSQHLSTLYELIKLNYKGTILVEKPLFGYSLEMPEHNFKKGFVAYNLRFHPIIQRIYELIKEEKIISVQAYVGQYLPLWRPQTDYRSSYSAKKDLGGGVLRDLSHELDYLNWLLGGWQKLSALGGHFSHLDIDSEDVSSVMMVTNKCPIVTLQMNYLDRVSRREILINTDRNTIKADLVNGVLWLDGQIEEYKIDRDYTYRCQHESILQSKFENICTFEEGLEIVKMIEAIEVSIKDRVWIDKC